MTGTSSGEHTGRLAVAGGYAADRYGLRALVRFAAAAPDSSEDPVDQALRRAVGPAIPKTEEFSPATPERKYSIARAENLIVLRGDVEAVLSASRLGRADRALVRRNARDEEKRGRRCLGIALAEQEDAAGSDGESPGSTAGATQPRFVGFVSITEGEDLVAPRREEPGGYAKVEVWPLALRIQHWLNLALIVLLSLTGYFIMDPFLVPRLSADTGYLMGWIRFLHIAAGFGWIAVAVWRLSLLFVARTKHMQWRSLWPIYRREDFVNMMRTLRYYLFIPGEHPSYIGHNALQQLTYTAIYGICFVQMLTGMGLYALAEPQHGVWALLTMPVNALGIPVVRLIHTLIMFVLWAFVILHVYLVLRSDALEKSGDTSSMLVTGYVLMRRGTQPVNGPEVE